MGIEGHERSYGRQQPGSRITPRPDAIESNPRTLSAEELFRLLTDPYRKYSKESLRGLSDGEVSDFERLYDQVTGQLGYRPRNGTAIGTGTGLARGVRVHAHHQFDGVVESRQVTLIVPGDGDGVRSDRVWTFGNGVHVFEIRAGGFYEEIEAYHGRSAGWLMEQVATDMKFAPPGMPTRPSRRGPYISSDR